MQKTTLRLRLAFGNGKRVSFRLDASHFLKQFEGNEEETARERERESENELPKIQISSALISQPNGNSTKVGNENSNGNESKAANVSNDRMLTINVVLAEAIRLRLRIEDAEVIPFLKPANFFL